VYTMWSRLLDSLESSNLLHIVYTTCQPTLQHHNSHNRTKKDRQWKRSL